MRLSLFLFGMVLFLPLPGRASWQNEIPPQQKSNGKVCVAVVGNASAQSAFVERMTARLTQGLAENKIDAVTMDSRTTAGRQLQPTEKNGNEARDKQCDYLLLTQIVDRKAHPLEPHGPEISIGGKVPSVDASDSSGELYRDNLQINFALFRLGRYNAVLEASHNARPSGNVSDNLVQAMDGEANRVSRELKKK